MHESQVSKIAYCDMKASSHHNHDLFRNQQVIEDLGNKCFSSNFGKRYFQENQPYPVIETAGGNLFTENGECLKTIHL